MRSLRPYQNIGIDKLAHKASLGKKRLIFQLATGGGKCLGRDTPILMYNGTFKMVQEVAKGDLLMGTDSKPRKVLSTCTGIDNLYRIDQLKGDSFVCNEPHVLSLKSNTTKYGYVKDHVYNIPLNEYLLLPKHHKHLLKLYKCTGIDFKEQPTFLEPYFLGLWLGDGNSRSVVITNMDYEVVSYLNDYCYRIKHTITERPNGNTKAKQYHIGTKFKHFGIRYNLHKSGLICNKHIPKEYLFNSKKKRLELLAGLVDTDGYLHHNGYEIFTVSEKLKDDIVFLTRSLGFSTTVSKKPGVNGFKILFYGIGVEDIPVKIERKKAKARGQIKDALRCGFTVTPIGKGGYYGFELDGDHLFMLGDLTVTHNTVCFAGLANRFLNRQQKKIVILVHREELLRQALRTLFEWYDISAAPITANSTYLPNVMVYVAMVETANNRLKKNPDYFGNVGLVIVDECHIGNFKKLYDYFNNSLIIGFTATPISGSKKDPLKNHFEDIVCGIDIPDLIQQKSLCPNKTYHIRNIERKALAMKNGEFDESQMGSIFSGAKHVQNTITAYRNFSEFKKTLVFNCNIEHSKKVNDIFQSFGYPSRHLDGETDPKVRAETLQWFKNTPNAILNNVGILTAGFDEPSVETVIINRATMSLPLWLQMTGRGSRPFTNKDFFTIIDMGGNALYHGDWCESRDWSDIFFHPEKPKGPGEAPVKECVSCKVVIHLSQKICPHCGAINTKAVKYDEGIVKFELLSSQKPIEINVAQLVEEHSEKLKADGQPYKDISVLHTIKYKIIIHAQRTWRLKKIDDKTAYKLIDLYEARVSDWVKIKGDKYGWCNKVAKEWMTAELKRVFNWEPVKLTA